MKLTARFNLLKGFGAGIMPDYEGGQFSNHAVTSFQ